MSRTVRLLTVLLLAVLIPAGTWAQRKGAPAKRVQPPTFKESTVEDYFFKDAFSILQGERPRAGSAPAPLVAAPPPDPAGATASGGGGKHPWSKIISAEVIEDEIKAVKLAVDQDVTTPGDFKGRGYKLCRRHLTVAAMLFGVIDQFDGRVRWQEGASGLRDVMARTAKNCKVGTTQVYNECKQRKQDLQDAVGGASYQGPPGEAEATWPQICDRSPLMQRLDIALHGRLEPAVRSAGEFKGNKSQVVHEAQLVAAIGEVLMKESMEDAGDEEYDGFSTILKESGRDIVDGVELDSYEQVRQAVGRINQACTQCHELYKA